MRTKHVLRTPKCLLHAGRVETPKNMQKNSPLDVCITIVVENGFVLRLAFSPVAEKKIRELSSPGRCVHI